MSTNLRKLMVLTLLACLPSNLTADMPIVLNLGLGIAEAKDGTRREHLYGLVEACAEVLQDRASICFTHASSIETGRDKGFDYLHVKFNVLSFLPEHSP